MKKQATTTVLYAQLTAAFRRYTGGINVQTIADDAYLSSPHIHPITVASVCEIRETIGTVPPEVVASIADYIHCVHESIQTTRAQSGAISALFSTLLRVSARNIYWVPIGCMQLVEYICTFVLLILRVYTSAWIWNLMARSFLFGEVCLETIQCVLLHGMYANARVGIRLCLHLALHGHTTKEWMELFVMWKTCCLVTAHPTFPHRSIMWTMPLMFMEPQEHEVLFVLLFSRLFYLLLWLEGGGRCNLFSCVSSSLLYTREQLKRWGDINERACRIFCRPEHHHELLTMQN